MYLHNLWVMLVHRLDDLLVSAHLSLVAMQVFKAKNYV